MKSLDTSSLRAAAASLKAGERILLSGVVYTARDAAHKRIVAALKNSEPLPFELKDAVIFYSGATPAPEGLPIGSCGPTTSSRMDVFTPLLHDSGVLATIGKGARSSDVVESIKRNGALYLCAVGGAGALAAKCVTACEVIAYDDLGCESIKKLVLCDLPLIVAVDTTGTDLFA